MTSTPTLGSELRAFYAEESTRIQSDFAAKGDGRAAIYSRTTVVESILLRLWNQYISPEKNGPAGIALVALGGFGRKWLFPHSDIDLLFLHANERSENEFKERVRHFSQEIWDLRMKLSPATRKLSECDRFDPENLEFAVSLLDGRYLAGDPALAAQLQDASIPKLLAREGKAFSQRLQVRRNRLPSRTQYKRRAWWASGLQRRLLAEYDFAARQASCIRAGSSRFTAVRSATFSPRARFPDVRPLFSPLPPQARQ
jgi:UTP:GlnB (protein PII) uridylyltransferase